MRRAGDVITKIDLYSVVLCGLSEWEAGGVLFVLERETFRPGVFVGMACRLLSLSWRPIATSQLLSDTHQWKDLMESHFARLKDR